MERRHGNGSLHRALKSRGVPRSKISFLPNGTDTGPAPSLPPDDELLDRWSLHGKKTFVYIGTLAYYHGLSTLIDAAALLRASRRHRLPSHRRRAGAGTRPGACSKSETEQRRIRKLPLRRDGPLLLDRIRVSRSAQGPRGRAQNAARQGLSCAQLWRSRHSRGPARRRAARAARGWVVSVPAEDSAALARAIESLADDP